MSVLRLLDTDVADYDNKAKDCGIEHNCLKTTVFLNAQLAEMQFIATQYRSRAKSSGKNS